jgi:hypothetical protein
MTQVPLLLLDQCSDFCNCCKFLEIQNQEFGGHMVAVMETMEANTL